MLFLVHSPNDISLRTSCQLSPLTNSSRNLFFLIHTFTTKNETKVYKFSLETVSFFENYNTIPTCDSMAIIAGEKVIEWNPLPGKSPPSHISSHTFPLIHLLNSSPKWNKKRIAKDTKRRKLQCIVVHHTFKRNLGVKTSFFTFTMISFCLLFGEFYRSFEKNKSFVSCRYCSCFTMYFSSLSSNKQAPSHLTSPSFGRTSNFFSFLEIALQKETHWEC